MPAIVVVGMQWGDEGKGKIVDYLAEDADGVARFQGGNNAGHTVVLGDEKYKLHLIPSGVLYPDKRMFIGAGVVVNPEVILEEIQSLEKRGIKPNLTISEKAHVILSFHILQDKLADKAQGKLSAGSTQRGIAPVYSDKTARQGIRMIDLLDEEVLKEKLGYLVPLKQKTIKHVYGDNTILDEEEIFKQYRDYGKRLSKYVGNVSLEINKLLDQKKRVVLEGAQGTMLCLDHGVYPYGTSSNPIAGAACVGAGVGPTKISKVVGVVKAYTSRVGSGPLPTELLDKRAEMIREKGDEYGTTTGRPRRIGWLDLVTLRYGIMISGVTELALTKLDVLSGVEELKICTHYDYKGKRLEHHPAGIGVFRECKGVYKTFKGFEFENGVKSYDELPSEAKSYVDFVEKSVGIPIKMVGVGPERSELILR